MNSHLPDPQRAALRWRRHCSLRPELGLILGSGFQGALDRAEVVAEMPFHDLPGFPTTTVAGHAGHLLAARLDGTSLLVLSGRAHFYEGYALETVTFPIRVLAALGVRDLLLTNAAGAIHRRFRAGDFMRVEDHINGIGANPLRGPVSAGLKRFVDLTQAYDPHLSRLLDQAARTARVRLHSGVYMAVPGPSYETPAEIRAFARLGADAVGMSTVPEVIVARQCGLRVAALSCLTNLAAGRSKVALAHEDVLATGRRVEAQARRLIESFIQFYAERCADSPARPTSK